MADMGAVGRIINDTRINVATTSRLAKSLPNDALQMRDITERSRVLYADQATIAGVVGHKVMNVWVPLARKVRAWRMDTGELAAEGMSDAMTGAIVLSIDAPDQQYEVLCEALPEDLRNAPRFIHIVPVPR